MRIVSLLPAATDWLCAFGAGAEIVGRSHACDAPAAAGARVLTAAPGMPPAADGPPEAIDKAVRRALAAGLSPFRVDAAALAALRPDLVVTQSLCGVCAPDRATLETALGAALAGAGSAPATLVDFAPSTLKQALDAALALGRAAGRLPEAMRVVAEGEARLRALAARLRLDRRAGTVAGRPFPTLVCVEWVAPPMTAGHWTPDLALLAGGRALLAAPGARSAYVTWDEIAAADPDVLVVAACGRPLEASARDLAARAGAWSGLRAARAGRAFVADGDRLFNRPGPSLVEAAEVLAAALHPEAAPPPPAWALRPLCVTPP
ncbi:MAG: ABC transporter substrate-binding protein [Rubricoccaceae bacterium]